MQCRLHALEPLLSFVTAGMCIAAFAGCSNTSYLAKGEKLYTGAEITVESHEDMADRGAVEDQLEMIAKPEPNGKFLGLFRLKLWMYNIGIFKESFGEPPVLLRSVSPDRIALRMRSLMENKGYFSPEVQYAIREDESTAGIHYTITVTPPYRIQSVTLHDDGSPLMNSLHTVMKATLLVPGEQYSLEKLKQERERIADAMKEKGYYYFSPDFIQFQADSSVGEKMIGLSLRVKKGIPAEASKVYTIGNIYFSSGYFLNRDSVHILPADTLYTGGCYYIDLDKKFDPDVIVRSIFFKKGSLYSRTDHELTLNRLMNLGVFKFVNIRFVDTDSAGVPRLDIHLYATPLTMKNIGIELQGVSKSNNLAGPVLNSSFRNRNFFGGAELFTVSFEVGFETPVSRGASGGNSYEVGTRGELDLPKFVTPFSLGDLPTLFVPRTRMALGFHVLHRLEYYQMFSVDASFGYHWKQSALIEHNFNLLSITLAQLTGTTQKFNDLLNGNPLLRKSFEEQFIIGENYSFTYNDQFEKDLKNHLYFKGTVDLSGNLLHAGQSIFSAQKGTSDTPYKIFGTIYSQYSRVDIDLRHYYNNLDQTSSIASRFIAGIGVAYGNSATMPYVKQFYIGGSNSVRAFVPGGLGPGAYKLPDSMASRSFVDQTADIKLEASTEYRFPMISILNGALFIDAGNIWLLREDPNRPGGRFSGATFLDETAVGTGFGLRFDLSFFIIRFDIGFPLKIPSRPVGDRWVIKKIDFGDPVWRKNNLALNIAIGYPY